MEGVYDTDLKVAAKLSEETETAMRFLYGPKG